MEARVNRLLIAGTASSVGKTSVTCGLLRLLVRRGLAVRACKCGPDYIDPQFHERVLGVPSCNLDLFLAGRDLVCELMAEGASNADVTIVEGAMGYYDGIAGGSDASAYDVACKTHTPVVLVVDARGKSLSIAAEILGFCAMRTPSYVAGVILNNASPAAFELLRDVVKRETGISVLGYMPRMEEAHVPSRHLGLVGAREIRGLRRKVDAVADVMAQTVDVEGLLSLAQSAPPLVWHPRALPKACNAHPVVAVARDEAFSFVYPETLRILELLGACVTFFSPLADEGLPPHASGLYLCGGYPELHARALSGNVPMRAAILGAVRAGMPTIAECGGFLYLHASLEDADGRAWPVVGAIAARARKGERLRHFGYVSLEARENSLLADAGMSLAAHEFHYWQSDAPSDAFCAKKPQSTRSWDTGYASPTFYAAFPHLYLYGAPHAAQRFVEACAAFAPGVCETGRGG